MNEDKALEQQDGEDTASTVEAAPVYSIYTQKEKYAITLLVSLIGIFSTLSSPIYLPVLPTLERKFGVGEKQMNVSVVLYSVFQGIAPSLMSNLADRYGRRITFALCLILYIGADIGLALNNSFAGLLVLRCVQAAGVASTISVSSGVVADITERENRGGFVGINQGIQLIGQAFGGLLGGLLDTGFGWRGIFWFLTIAAGAVWLITHVLVPETNRAIVGNGSNAPKQFRWISYAPILFLPTFKKRLANPEPSTIVPRRLLNPLDSLLILKNPTIMLVMLPVSVLSTCWIMMLTTLSLSLNQYYNYTTLQVGLCYLPSGVGGVCGSVTAGRFADWNYRRLYRKYTVRSQDPDEQKAPFDALLARVQVVMGPAMLTPFFLIMFGWCIDKVVHVATVCVSSFFTSFFGIMSIGTSMTILIDLFPNRASAAAACLNLCRCLLSALGIGVLAYMTDSMTVGGCYSLLAGVALLSSLTYFYILANTRRLTAATH
ncbi:unnamed protein product [Kuraishia capsulata CBS 1993]|uniref:Major facilitator superfamily (MFS) profile domain-containing protein n=1 Tax=Kuraishia capsulata CBS 1993 TaxID=1382522 RepID=W6MR95_9ASCO|nr:uncharacterized protein KUCA_T00005239001 [Kuraishia capsulata CBS 1993]CDK29251.1 unnamed protein product [Kuraishia capsulata CBS 1993]